MILLLLSRYVRAQLEENLLNLINDYRRREGLCALETEYPLLKAAQKHADFLCVSRKITHAEYMQNKNLSNRLLNLDYTGEKIGENIAKEYGDDVHEVFKVWMASFHHRENIVGEYDGIGVATCKNSLNERYWAVVFGKSANRKKRSIENVLESFPGGLKPGPDDKIVIVVNRNDLKRHDPAAYHDNRHELPDEDLDPQHSGQKGSVVINIEDNDSGTPPTVEIPNDTINSAHDTETPTHRESIQGVEIIDTSAHKDRSSNHLTKHHDEDSSFDNTEIHSENSQKTVIEILDERLRRFRKELLNSLSLNDLSWKAQQCDTGNTERKKSNHLHEIAELRNSNHSKTKSTCKGFVDEIFDKEHQKSRTYGNTSSIYESSISTQSFADIFESEKWSSIFSSSDPSKSDTLSIHTGISNGTAVSEFSTLKPPGDDTLNEPPSHSVYTVFKTVTIFEGHKSRDAFNTSNLHSVHPTVSNMRDSQTFTPAHISYFREATDTVSTTPDAYYSSQPIPIQDMLTESLKSLHNNDFTTVFNTNNDHKSLPETSNVPIPMNTMTKIFKANVEGSFVEINDPQKNKSWDLSNKEQDDIENTLKDLRNLLNNNISNHHIKIVLSKGNQKPEQSRVEIDMIDKDVIPCGYYAFTGSRMFSNCQI